MVENRDVLRLDPMAIARSVGYVAQRQTAGRLAAFDAILMGRRPHIRWRVTAQDLRIVDAAIKSLNLQSLTMRYIDQMSGGELQKVAIGRALVQEPHLFLLDEPTSSLDLKNQMEILKLIKRVASEHMIGVVMTMHNLNMALRFADKYLFLKSGRIYAVGNATDISAKTIEAVYGLPVDVQLYKGHPVIIPTDSL